MSGGRETDSGVQDQSGDNGSIGARLVAARNRRQLTQESVARQLRLDIAVINALENDDTRVLPAPIFVQGYLRSYARLLGLPEDELVKDYTVHSGELPPLTVNRVGAGKPSLRLPSMRLIRNVILVILAAILIWLASPFLNKLLQTQDQLETEQSPGHLEIPPAEQ